MIGYDPNLSPDRDNFSLVSLADGMTTLGPTSREIIAEHLNRFDELPIEIISDGFMELRKLMERTAAMADLFEPTLQDEISCVRREITMRSRVYPRRVADGHMKQEAADREIETMRAVLRRLEGIA